MTIKEYREHPAFHYSELSALWNSPSSMIAPKDFSKSNAIRLGSAVDCLITTPDKFDDEFIVCSEYNLSGQMKQFTDYLIDGNDKEEAYNLVGFKRDKFEKVCDKFEGSEYEKFFKFVTEEVKDKIILSRDELADVKLINETLKSHKFTKKYFNPENENISLYYQVPIICNFENNELKALFDLIVVDHDNKTIQPIDLKTTSESVYGFFKSFEKYRYDIQCSLYQTVLLNSNEVDKILDSDVCGYTILDFKFVYISFKNTSKPLVYSDKNFEVVKNGRYGWINSFGKEFTGWEKLIEDYRWHRENDLYDYSRNIYENDGIIYLYEEYES